MVILSGNGPPSAGWTRWPRDGKSPGSVSGEGRSGEGWWRGGGGR